ncbi:MAG: YdeI/OmpD-associated family protein [Bacteroidota bacterium]
MEKPLVDIICKLQKFPGKGGWTFVRIPPIPHDKSIHTLKVKGSIDNYILKKHGLMVSAKGPFFLPIKAEIRKKIKKEAGDTVHIILYPDHDPVDIPIDLLVCLEEEPLALQFFKTLSISEQQFYIQWISSAKKEETKINRLAKTITKLLKGLKLYQKEN